MEPRNASAWPDLPLASWADTASTLHMWTQIVGKVRLALSPHMNHWWQVPLYVGPRGLSTSAMPYRNRVLEMEFDFLDHQLAIRDSRGANRHIPLYARPVADFYREFTAVLRAMDVEVKIWPKPVEVPDPIPFPDDLEHASYDPVAVGKFHRILLSVDSALKEFRAGYLGKVSPVHFFWGSFDLAVTRFSGRPAPERTGADPVTREAYSHECSSAGFWPGGGLVADPAFYSYAAPEPAGYAESSVRPPAGFYHPDLKEFILMYRDVRTAASPERALRDFLESTYEAAASLGNWDRAALEHPAMPKHCAHLDQIRLTRTDVHVCEDCVKTGDSWVHLRLCLTCGHVGCCDSSKNRHATKHFDTTKHPLIRSAEPGENWLWCYVDQVSPEPPEPMRKSA